MTSNIHIIYIRTTLLLGVISAPDPGKLADPSSRMQRYLRLKQIHPCVCDLEWSVVRMRQHSNGKMAHGIHSMYTRTTLILVSGGIVSAPLEPSFIPLLVFGHTCLEIMCRWTIPHAVGPLLLNQCLCTDVVDCSMLLCRKW